MRSHGSSDDEEVSQIVIEGQKSLVANAYIPVTGPGMKYTFTIFAFVVLVALSLWLGWARRIHLGCTTKPCTLFCQIRIELRKTSQQ